MGRTQRGTCVLALVAAMSTTARADDTNYQNYILGERAMGMGGAFTAIGDDASAAFYNPGGAAFIRGSSLSTSLHVYGVDRLRVTRGYTAVLDSEPISIDFDDRGLATLPTTLGFVRKFGSKMADGNRRIALGVSVFVRDEIKRNIDAVLLGPSSRGAYTLSIADKTLWFGPFFAYRLRDRLSVGGAMFFSNRSVRRERSSAIESEFPNCVPPGCPSSDIRIDQEIVSYSSRDLFGRFGARFDVNPNLHLGLTVTTPSVHAGGSGTVIGKHQLTMIDPVTGQGTAEYDPRENRGRDTRNDRGLEIRGGWAFGFPKHYQVAADVTLHGPVDFEPVDLVDPSDPDAAIVSLLHIPRVKRERVVNVNLGGEYYLASFIPVRGGFFTNRSSAPDVVASDENQLEHIDMYGFTASIGYVTKASYEVSFGMLYSFGSGDFASWDPEAGATGQYVPTTGRRDSLYFYLSGAKKGVKRVSKDVKQRWRDRVKYDPQADVKEEGK